MLKIVDRLLLNDVGATALEYGIIAALVSTAIITVVLAMGVSIADLYQSISLNFQDAIK